MRIRSITVFARTELPPDAAAMSDLGQVAREVEEICSEAGYEVQTLRYATDAFPTLERLSSEGEIVTAVRELEAQSLGAGFDYVALGPAGTGMLRYLPAILESTETVFATTHIVSRSDGRLAIDGDAIRGAAQVIRAAAGIEGGFGNLRFAALANVPQGTPFFPAAYWTEETPAFAIATESADLALSACSGAADAAEAHRRLRVAVASHGTGISTVCQGAARAHGVRFLGVDFSLAPHPDPAISIGGALEALTGQPLGAPGTLAAAATLTDAVQGAQFLHTGFCGLMMPVLEDSVLAQRAAEGRLHVSDLLQWSAVCGTGLDTVPLPGDVSEQAIASLLFDVAALSLRLQKPLTARLMPLPGKVAGDPVHFDFAYFADGGVLGLDEVRQSGALTRTTALALAPYAYPD